MTAIATPLNSLQVSFNDLCEKGGGPKGGPATKKIKELLRFGGKNLTALGVSEAKAHLEALPDANPWHICFAIGLTWGHLAKQHIGFTEAVVRLLSGWNQKDLDTAKSFHMERGPDPIEHSLAGAHFLFSRVILPPKLPSSLDLLRDAQNRWLSPILSPSRPRYIGSWNATAMFMIALFAQPELAATMMKPGPMLPPNGPMLAGLKLLHRHHVLSRAPSGSELDDQAFEPGALYENNALFVELLEGITNCNLVDIHSSIYLLGTRSPLSNQWT